MMGVGVGVLPSSGPSQGQLHIRQSFNIPINKRMNESKPGLYPFLLSLFFSPAH